jgi:hypothetical protein
MTQTNIVFEVNEAGDLVIVEFKGEAATLTKILTLLERDKLENKANA